MELKECAKVVKDHIAKTYKANFREPAPRLPYPFLVPGANYTHQLWDWDSWLTGTALIGIDDPDIEKYEKGCVLDFLENMDQYGRIPILVEDRPNWLFDLNENYKGNIHKPCLAIQALDISTQYGDLSWIAPYFDKILKYLEYYEKNQKHAETGLYYWIDDLAIGFDNDPSVFYHQDRSVAAIYLNSLMYKELVSASELAKQLGREEAAELKEKADSLAKSIQNECFDGVDGFFYSADITLKPVDPNNWLHSGHPRFWKSLPIKVTTWAGMLPLWAGIATKEQAERCVKRYLNPEGLYSQFGVRSLAKNEKMYAEVDSGNPSCWLGPIWINANWFVYEGLKKYGYADLAHEIAEKTIRLLAADILENHDFHEYYNSNTGVGIRGIGFQSWNFLVLRMIDEL